MLILTLGVLFFISPILQIFIYLFFVFLFIRKQNYIGKVKFASFDTVSKTPKIIVATEENVIAALSIKTGEIYIPYLVI